MTAVSTPLAFTPLAPQPMETASQSPRSGAPADSAFSGQLREAIQERKGETKDTKQRDSNSDSAAEPVKKKDDSPQPPVIVAVIVAAVAVPLPASLGLPSAGVDPGSGTAVSADIAAASVIDAPAPGSLQIDPPTPPAEAAPSDPKAELAFALRVVDLTPGREATAEEPIVPQTTPAVVARNPAVAPLVIADFPPSPAPIARGIPASPVAATELPATPERAPGVARTPRVVSQTAVPTTAPDPSAAPQPEGATSDSNSPAPDSGSSERQLPKEAPKPNRPLPYSQPQAAESKPWQPIVATAAAASIGFNGTALPMPGPAPIAGIYARAPEPSGIVTIAPLAEHVAATPAPVRPSAASELTDLSVTIPVPRADLSGDDRVAIRMIQRGAEIHVSVRTPDSQLTQSLRQDLGKLSIGLDQAGFRTETWRPVVTNVAALSQSGALREASQDAPHRDAAAPDGRSDGRQGRGPGEQKRRQQDERPHWVAELERQKNR